MQVTATPAPNSSMLLEIEVPAERLDRADPRRRRPPVPAHAGRRLPAGKAPRPILERVLGPGAVLDEAVEHLVQDAYREAIVEQDIVPLTNADVEVVEAEEGKPLRFKATVQVRPRSSSATTRTSSSRPRSRTIDDAQGRQGRRRAARPERDARGGRGARREGRRLGRHRVRGHRDGVPFDGGTTERMPLIIGEDRLIPGFEANLVGLEGRRLDRLRHHVPRGLPRASLAGEQVQFAVDLKELREKVLPEADDAFAQSMGDYADLAALKADIAERLRPQRPRPGAPRVRRQDHRLRRAPTRPSTCPTILVDQEVEVMHDEFRRTLARQGISEAAYLKATEKTEADLHTEFRPRAEQRVKVLLVLSKVAEIEGIDVRDDDVEAQVELARQRYATTRRPSATSSRSAAATSSGARCAARRSSRRWSTAGSPPTRITRRCRTSRTTTAVRRRGARGRGGRIHRRHRSGLHPGATAAAAAER